MRRSMDWTMENNMAEGLFFCAILTGRRRAHTPFVQAGAEKPDTGALRLSGTQALLGKVTPRVWVSGMKMRSLVGLSNYSALHWWSAHCAASIVIVVRWTDELLYDGYIWLSPFATPCICTRLTGEHWVEQVSKMHSTDRWALSWTGVQAPWHGVLETVWPHCDEAQQVGCLRGLEGCPLV